LDEDEQDIILNDFLKYWFHEYNNRQESSRLEPMYMKKQTKKQSGECPTGVQQEASEIGFWD